jgi:membrane associated rhomboid family serine protease
MFPPLRIHTAPPATATTTTTTIQTDNNIDNQQINTNTNNNNDHPIITRRRRRSTTPAAIAAQALATPGAALVHSRQWWRTAAPLKGRLLKTFSVLTMFILSIVFIASLVNGSIVSTRINPTVGPSSCTLLHMGAKFSPLIVRRNEGWRLITSIFVSSGFFTYTVYVILTGALMLPMEIAFGTLPTGITFLLSGLLSNIFSTTSSVGIECGAGGALMGIVGLRVACIILCWTDLEFDERRRVGLLEVISSVLLFFTGLSPNVDNAAHFAGLVCGSFIGATIFAPKLDATPAARLVARVMAFCGVVFISGIWISLVASGGFDLIDGVILSTVCSPSDGARLLSPYSKWSTNVEFP